jgi:hypothetical protein
MLVSAAPATNCTELRLRLLQLLRSYYDLIRHARSYAPCPCQVGLGLYRCLALIYT